MFVESGVSEKKELLFRGRLAVARATGCGEQDYESEKKRERSAHEADDTK